jgi:hypothetical protein
LADCCLIEGLESICFACAGNLCLREQILNLALGEEENLLCLFCLAQENGCEPEELLLRLKTYIESRDCFNKQWQKYVSSAACPRPLKCLPLACFSCKNEKPL